MSTDPITMEIIRNGLNAIAEEMNANLARSAFSPIIYEMKDCSVAIFNEDCDLLGQAPGLPIFLGALAPAVRAVKEHFSKSGIQEGDIYALNDPYLVGSHLNDVTVVSPVFIDDELVGFTANKAHWLDMGSKDAGVSVDTTEVYQEGLRFGPIRLYDKGEAQDDILDILARNSRLPLSILGDLHAQVAACRSGERRYQEFLSAFGLDMVRECTKEIFRQAEASDRAFVKSIPDGVYSAEGYMDSDGSDEEPVKIAVAVTIRDTEMHLDLSGSSLQRKGCTNCGIAQTISAAQLAYKFIVNPEQTPNGGNFRALSVTAPEGTIFAAQEPAACDFYASPSGLMIELTLKALSEAIVGRIPAGGPHDQMNFIVAGRDENGTLFITGEASAVGWGALPDADGPNATVCYMAGDLKNLPAEVEEAKFPLRVNCRTLEEDSGGAGRFRGGLAMIKEYEAVAPGVSLLLWLERTVTPGWGVAGGKDGQTARCIWDLGGTEERTMTKANHFALPVGKAIRCHTAGGGGYGPPWERDIQGIIDDVLDGYVTRQAAEVEYGVRWGEGRMTVDEHATKEARSTLAKSYS